MIRGYTGCQRQQGVTGKTFENAVGGMIDAGEATMIGKLETAFGLSVGGLSDFTSVKQLQVNVGSTFFIADRALIKKLSDGSFDVYILEMKISSGTSLTTNQNNFITSTAQSNTFTTRSTKIAEIPSGSRINVLGAKRIDGPVSNYIINIYK